METKMNAFLAPIAEVVGLLWHGVTPYSGLIHDDNITWRPSLLAEFHDDLESVVDHLKVDQSTPPRQALLQRNTVLLQHS